MIKITQQQEKIVKMVGEGMTNKAIGEAIDRSEHTVRNTLAYLLMITNTNNRIKLFNWLNNNEYTVVKNLPVGRPPAKNEDVLEDDDDLLEEEPTPKKAAAKTKVVATKKKVAPAAAKNVSTKKPVTPAKK